MKPMIQKRRKAAKPSSSPSCELAISSASEQDYELGWNEAEDDAEYLY